MDDWGRIASSGGRLLGLKGLKGLLFETCPPARSGNVEEREALAMQGMMSKPHVGTPRPKLNLNRRWTRPVKLNPTQHSRGGRLLGMTSVALPK